MNNVWGDFEFNEPYEGELIKVINDIKLPAQYIDFMQEHNGGEGDLGETWFILYRLEELKELNDDYVISDFLPDCIIIGSDGGGELYGINKKGEYFNVPDIMEIEELTLLGNDINELPIKINDMWK